MLLKNKNAIIYGASGAVGGAVARAFCREGAKVFLAGRSKENLDNVANEIAVNGGIVETSEVDVLNPIGVEEFVNNIVAKTGHIDISFCAVSTHIHGGEQGAAFSELTYENFSLPIIDYTKSQFLTATAASKHMIKRGSGVILMITAVPSRIPYPFTAGFGPAWAAVEAMSRTMAAEFGPYGVRTVCLRSAGSPEAEESIGRTLTSRPELAARMEGWHQRSTNRNLLNKWPTLEEVGHVAAFMASDRASTMTGITIDLSGGMIND